MKNAIILLIGVIILFAIPSMVLKSIYGPSYTIFSGEDSWVPDNAGGWQAHGQPSGSPPDETSVTVPIAVRYIPILLPALLMILFMFTPLSRIVDKQNPEPECDDTQHEDAPANDHDSDEPPE